MNMLKSACVAASIILGMSNVGAVLAKSTDPQVLGVSPIAVDIWSVSCPSGTQSAAATVEDLPTIINRAWVRLALVKHRTDSQSAGADLTQDRTEGGSASPKAVLFGSRFFGAQVYKIAPGQPATDKEAYRLNVVCNTPTGPREPILMRSQNQ